MQIKKRNINY